MPYTIKRRAEFMSAQWAGGSTTELFVHPVGSANAERNFEIRISTATVDLEESVFSNFSGYERSIAPLAGNMRLEHEGHHSVTLRPCESDSFSGDWVTRSFGKCVDFNCIHRPGWRGGIRPFAGPAEQALDNTGYVGIYALHDMITASITLDGKTTAETLQTGDFLLIESSGGLGDSCRLAAQNAEEGCFAIAAWAFR